MAIFTREERAIIAQAKSILLAKSKAGQTVFDNPSIIKDYLMLNYAHYEREIFGVVMLDAKHRLIGIKVVCTGTLTSATIDAREVIKVLLKNNAGSAFIFHNHPSGSIEPSKADIDLTHSLANAFRIVDVRLLDHIVVGYEGAFSFMENRINF